MSTLNNITMNKSLINRKNDGPREYYYANEEAYIRARKKLDNIIGFYWHFAVYVVINLFLIVMISLYNVEAGESIFRFETFSTAFFWGIGLVFHWLNVFGPNWFFGKNWEERKLKEIMDKDTQMWE